MLQESKFIWNCWKSLRLGEKEERIKFTQECGGAVRAIGGREVERAMTTNTMALTMAPLGTLLRCLVHTGCSISTLDLHAPIPHYH